MRRGVGKAGLYHQQRRQQHAAATGEKMEQEQMSHLKSQMDVFRKHLQEFATKYREKINRDAEFRWRFHQMTRQIGVDPLASRKGFWAELLGVGDFYFDLGVQIVDVCMRTRSVNGGIVEAKDVLHSLRRLRGSDSQEIQLEDIERAVEALRILGDGFSYKNIGGSTYIISVPYELRADHTEVFAHVQAEYHKTNEAYTTISKLVQDLRWTQERAQRVLNEFIRDGMIWLDVSDTIYEPRYYFPALIPSLNNA